MKNLLLVCIGIFTAIPLIAQPLSEGPRHASTFATAVIPGSAAVWSNTGNAASSDDSYTSFGDLTGGAGLYTDYVVATNFQFNIPSGAVIQGIVVEIESSDPNLLTSDYSVRIVKGGVIGNEERALLTPYPATDTYRAYGGITDLWGESWNYKSINLDRFGVAVAAQRNTAGGTTAGQIDDIRIIVYYGLTTLPVDIISFSGTKNDKVIDLRWVTSSETNMSYYEVERSLDGRDFHSLGNIPSHNRSTVMNYFFTDKNPLPGLSYYRVKMNGTAGYTKYSKIVSLQFSTGRKMTLYPNPLVGGEKLQLSNPNREPLTIRFYTLSGKMVASLFTSSDWVDATLLKGQKGTLIYRILDNNWKILELGQIILK